LRMCERKTQRKNVRKREREREREKDVKRKDMSECENEIWYKILQIVRQTVNKRLEESLIGRKFNA